MLQVVRIFYIYYLVIKVSYTSLQPIGGCGKRRVALMKRIISVLAAMAIMAAMVVALAMPAFAAGPNGTGVHGKAFSNNGVYGQAGNIGGQITFHQGQNAGECMPINQGPFTSPLDPCL